MCKITHIVDVRVAVLRSIAMNFFIFIFKKKSYFYLTIVVRIYWFILAFFIFSHILVSQNIDLTCRIG